MAKREFDYVLVGGGLQNGLLTLALGAERPGARIALIEQAGKPGGNHTWCFHAGDVAGDAGDWIAPLVVHRWHGYAVVFPNHNRRITGGYSAITSERFHEVIAAQLDRDGCELLCGSRATEISAHEVVLENGRSLSARLVVDSRGPAADSSAITSTGYQKFFGMEVALDGSHGLDIPVLMDATVDQSQGFRFLYVLPLAADRLLVEDTYFHESSELDRELLRRSIHEYCDAKGYRVTETLREESGVLPMPWANALPQPGTGPIRGGYAGGWFHPGTGYSLPVAARLATFIARQDPGAVSLDRFAGLIRRHRVQAKYCHFLNRMLFRWYPPAERWHIFERFYRMPQGTIDRFYALRMSLMDRVRLLSGKPPAGLSPAYRMRAGGAA